MSARSPSAAAAPAPGQAALAGFSEPTRSWFAAAFAAPTQAQADAWAAIRKGKHALVIAPTGSGKTLAAFLWAIDKLATAPPPPDPALRCRVLYISPLKALAVDIERNLRSPLTGIGQAMRRRGLAEPDIRIGVRTGDTAADERRQFTTKPPDILITTPESLFLLLTSRARAMLRGVETVIVDEVHALAGGKRGAHLALSLERLDALRGAADGAQPGAADDRPMAGARRRAAAGDSPPSDAGQPAGPAGGDGAHGSGGPDSEHARPAQRIGLSATVRPPEEVAAFLGGSQPVTIVQPPSDKQLDLKIIVPVEDMSDVATGHPTEQPGFPGAQPWAAEAQPWAAEAQRWAAEDQPWAGEDQPWFPGGADSQSFPAEGGAAGIAAGPDGPPGRAAPAKIIGPAQVAGQSGSARPPRAVPGWSPARAGQPGASRPAPGQAPQGRPQNSIWPHVEARVLDAIERHRSTIVFANSRGLAERLCARLNELAGERAAERAEAAWLADDHAEPPDAPPVIARAHHGSVSRAERTQIEEALKAGRLPAVVATSSLELGIDMGAVDLVIQVESPPSVASGLQRTGRAGHNVGDISRSLFFPKYRGDLLQSAVVADRMRAGKIEELRMPRNPLDVLAQHIVAMTAMDDWDVGKLMLLVRRAAPFSTLTRPVLDAVLDMLAGRYPSEEFAGLRPRLIWDRAAGVLRGRPGSQRLAVTNGGTIPDRGLFGVFLAGARDPSGRHSRRVGELDEEMVYESRVGDIFVLGASSWRIEDITADQVLVSPATGLPGRLPFWHGDAPGRPAELGRAIGAFCRELAAADPQQATAALLAGGLDDLAAGNLLSYLAGQREATGYLPDDRTLVLERFRDDFGDWRLILHSPFGAKVHAPWSLAISARLRERYGDMDVQAMYTDDGIVIRVPDADDPPPAGFALLDPDEVEPLVTGELGGSAVFAARFRECAARALLLPRRQPGHRSPLWQQRQRAAQLLAVASGYSSFPISLETMRECLQDVFDVPALTGLMRDLAGRKIRLVEVETPTASPFARSLLFQYVGAFMYEGDAPLAERRAQALTLDSALLAELLGQADLRELLDPQIVSQTEHDLQRLSPDRRCSTMEQLSDLIRDLGPLPAAEIAARIRPAANAARAAAADEAPASQATAGGPAGHVITGEPAMAKDTGSDDAPTAELAASWLSELAGQRRIIEVRVAGEPRWAAIEDAGRLRDALGTALPTGIPEAFTEVLPDPLGDLVARYARTHGPFTAQAVAQRYGLGAAVVTGMLHRLTADGRTVAGEFLPQLAGPQWCDAGVLRLLRRRCLARLRQEAEPVPPAAFAAYLPAWQGVEPATPPRAASGGTGPGRADRSGQPPGSPTLSGPGGWRTGRRRRPTGPDAVFSVVEQLAGAAVPASALESLILPARVEGYSPSMLDELTAAGEVVWTGGGALPGGDGWLVLAPAGSAHLLLPPPEEISMTPVHKAVLAVLEGGGALFFRGLADRVATWLADSGSGEQAAGGGAGGQPADQTGSQPGYRLPSDQAVAAAIWDLVWAGLLTNDTLAPLRTALASGRSWTSGRGTGGGDSGGAARGPRGRQPGTTREGHQALSGNRGDAAGHGSFGGPQGSHDFVPGTGRMSAGGRRQGFGRPALPSRTGPPTVSGRWSALPPAEHDQTRRMHARAMSMLDRYGIVIRGAASAERSPGGFGALYPVLRAMEESGQCRRGYFVEGLGAAQFALSGAVDRMRAMAGPAAAAAPGGAAQSAASVLVLAAADPANAYGAALPWPPRPDEAPGGHRPGRKSGALVVLVSGELVLYVERGGRTLLSWTSDPALLGPAAGALAGAVRAGALGRLTVERADGEGVYDSPLAEALERAGFRPTPRGLRLRG